MAFLCFCVCVTQNIRCHLVCICTRACLDQRGSNCASSDLENFHPCLKRQKSTTWFSLLNAQLLSNLNLVRCVCHCFTFSLVLGVSSIAIVVCLINILICSSGVLR